MRDVRWVRFVVVAGAAACQGTNTQWIEATPLEAGASVVLAIHSGDTMSVAAYDIDDRHRALRPAATIDGEGRIEALVYDEPLAVLGLPGGALAHSPNGAPLPPATRYWTTSIDGDDVRPWQMASAPSPDLTAFRIPSQVRSVCDDVVVSTVSLPSEEAAAGIATRPDGSVWIATQKRGEMFRFTDSISAVDIRPADIEVADMAATPDGTLWIAGNAPRALYRGRPTGNVLELEVVTSTLGRAPASRLDVLDDGSRAAVIDRWGRIHVAGDPNAVFDFENDYGTDHTALYFDETDLLGGTIHRGFVFRSSAEGSVMIETPDGSGISELNRVPGIGLVVGTTGRTVYVIENNVMRSLTTITLSNPRRTSTRTGTRATSTT